MKNKIFLFNTLGRKKEVFKPLKSDFVRMYDCGPTVYSFAHIGNLWRYLVSDFLRRILEYNGLKVKQVVNITDVGHLTEDDLLAADTGEDKIELAAKKEKKTPQEIAQFYTQAYFKDRCRLNILPPSIVCKATDHIPQMIKMIKKLEEKGYAYRLPDRVCFDVSKFKNYGALSGKKLAELKVGSRLEPIKGKKNPYDFSLWIVDPSHLMKWRSFWGVGYPGWHIECSAMSMKYLGSTLDIHTGGEDNIFPHHENEIAQSESYSGKKFVRFWIHIRFNLVDGKKMSKSKGNVYLLADLIKKGFDPLAFRYLALTNHYRSPLNFTFPSLKSAQKALNKLRLIVWQLKKETKPLSKSTSSIKKWQEKFLKAINNDIGTPQGLAVVWQLVDAKIEKAAKLKLLREFDQVLGLGLDKWDFKVPTEIKKLVRKREQLRKAKEFHRADMIREKIKKQGWLVEDQPEGPRILPDF